MSTKTAVEQTTNGIAAQVGPMVDRVTDQASNLAHRGLDAINDTTRRLRDKALDASDNTVRYIQTEPYKAVLIAAATGAALMALVSLMNRSRRD